MCVNINNKEPDFREGIKMPCVEEMKRRIRKNNFDDWTFGEKGIGIYSRFFLNRVN